MMWYLSFCDLDIAKTIRRDMQRPGGPSWLGACMVEDDDMADAVTHAWLLGCNPGGDVGGIPFTEREVAQLDNYCSDRWFGRLLSADDVDAFDAYMLEKA